MTFYKGSTDRKFRFLFPGLGVVNYRAKFLPASLVGGGHCCYVPYGLAVVLIIGVMIVVLVSAGS